MSDSTSGSTGSGPTSSEAHPVYYIEQPYHSYTPRDHENWAEAWSRMSSTWDRYVDQAILRNLDLLRACVSTTLLPRLEDIHRFVQPLTGFRPVAVGGIIPEIVFFSCLRKRAFPTTVTVRSKPHVDYPTEPDIFHDVVGHFPQYMDSGLADALARFGECAHTAADLVSEMKNVPERIRCLNNIIRAMTRLFWFTMDSGLIRSREGLRVYGAGMVSSCSESARALESLEVQRYPIELEWVVNQGFAPYAPQPLLFVVDSYDHLFSLIERLEKWISEGRLNNVAPGYPDVNDRYLVEFLQGDSAPPATLAMPVLSDSEISKSLGRTTPMRKEAKWM